METEALSEMQQEQVNTYTNTPHKLSAITFFNFLLKPMSNAKFSRKIIFTCPSTHAPKEPNLPLCRPKQPAVIIDLCGPESFWQVNIYSHNNRQFKLRHLIIEQAIRVNSDHFCDWETRFHHYCLLEGYRNPEKDRTTKTNDHYLAAKRPFEIAVLRSAIPASEWNTLGDVISTKIPRKR